MTGQAWEPGRDRTEMEGAEESALEGTASLRARELESLGLISSELLHDLGGLLAVVEGRLAVARSEAAMGRSNSSDLARVQDDTRELRRMIRDILARVRKLETPGEPAWPAAPLMEETLQRWLSSAPRVQVSLEMHLPRGSRVAGPRTFFTRALGNLVRNASRYAERKIRVSARTSDGGATLEIIVEDDGSGVAESLKTALFDPFTSGRNGRMGLGLSFSRWACEQLGGGLELLAVKGHLGGAVFRMWMPLLPPRQETPSHNDAPGEACGKLPAGVRIAVVDDDAALRRVLRRRLQREGARVFLPTIPPRDQCGNLLEDLARWDPEIILLDLHLGSVSGEHLFHTLSRRHPHLANRVLILTGGAPPEDELGVPVLNKLQDWDELIRQVTDVLESPGGSW
ncbi:MAG: sensor histidine kinase [Gemmatimonadales bacterium]|nr:MAG: sensor histidine kinase [Gemmatimonadales bacterium]